MTEKGMGFNRVTLGLLILVSLYWVTVMMAWFFYKLPIYLFQEPPLYIDLGGASYPVLLGRFSMTTPLLVLALLFLNLANEFFGRGVALMLSLSGVLALPAVWGMTLGVEFFINLQEATRIQGFYDLVLDPSPIVLIALIDTVVVGYGFFSWIYDGLRKLAHGRFFYIRVILAHVFGLNFVVVCVVASNVFPQVILGKALALYAAEYTHWLVLSLLALPVYFVVKLVCRLIVGRGHYEGIKGRYAKKKIVKPVDQDYFESRQERLEKRI